MTSKKRQRTESSSSAGPKEPQSKKGTVTQVTEEDARAASDFLKSITDLVAPNSWGFDETSSEATEKARDRQLRKNVLKKPQDLEKMSAEMRKSLARAAGLIPRFVSQQMRTLAAALPEAGRAPKTVAEKGAAAAAATKKEAGNSGTKAAGDGAIIGFAHEEAKFKLQKRMEEFQSLKQGRMDRTAWREKMERRRAKRKAAKEEKGKKSTKGAQKSSKVANDDGDKENAAKKKVKLEMENGGADLKTSADLGAEDMVYSKFDYIVRQPKKKLSKAEKRDAFGGKDYKRLLEKAVKREQRIKAVEAKRPDQASAIRQQVAWKKAESHAEGTKVRDDIAKLTKAMAAKEKDKKRKKEKWAKRVNQVEEKKAKKQEKRTGNIVKRKDDKKKRKTAKLRAKGRII